MSLSGTFARTLVAALPVVAPLVVVWSAPQAFAQDIDAMATWTAAAVIHYSVVGEFSGETRIMSFERTFPVSDSAQVTDRVEVEFDWDQQELKPVGAPVFGNFPSTTAALRVLEGCPATKIEGAFEFATIVEWKELPYPMSGIGLVLRRDYVGGAIPHPARESGAGACGHRWDRSRQVQKPTKAEWGPRRQWHWPCRASFPSVRTASRSSRRARVGRGPTRPRS
jgi:hypothetical protein